MAKQSGKLRMKRRFPAAEIESAHTMRQEPVDAVDKGVAVDHGAVGGCQAETAEGVAATGDAKADCLGKLQVHLKTSVVIRRRYGRHAHLTKESESMGPESMG